MYPVIIRRDRIRASTPTVSAVILRYPAGIELREETKAAKLFVIHGQFQPTSTVQRGMYPESLSWLKQLRSRVEKALWTNYKSNDEENIQHGDIGMILSYNLLQ